MFARHPVFLGDPSVSIAAAVQSCCLVDASRGGEMGELCRDPSIMQGDARSTLKFLLCGLFSQPAAFSAGDTRQQYRIRSPEGLAGSANDVTCGMSWLLDRDVAGSWMDVDDFQGTRGPKWSHQQLGRRHAATLRALASLTTRCLLKLCEPSDTESASRGRTSTQAVVTRTEGHASQRQSGRIGSDERPCR